MTKTLCPVSPKNSVLALEKLELRRYYIQLRDELSAEKAQECAHAATTRIISDAHWLAAQRVALYVNFKQEQSTQSLLDHAWAQGKSVYLPRCVPASSAGYQGNTLQFFACQGRDDVCPGTWGILEPDPARCPPLGAQLPDLLIMPAVALDRQGFRLGYGGGYYDRLLQDAHWHTVPRMGLVFACQIIPKLPREPWDIPVHALACEEALTWL